MVKNITIKEAAQTLGTTIQKFKAAQEGGTMSPEEVVETVQPIIEMAATIAEVASEIQEGVPAETPGVGPIGTAAPAEGPSAATSPENPPMDESEDDIREKMSQLQAQVDELEKEKTEMKESQEKEKLARKYAQLWPEPMREAKAQEFLGRSDSVSVLTAQVKEAEAIMGDHKAIRTAQKEEGTYELLNYDDENNQTITGAGKY